MRRIVNDAVLPTAGLPFNQIPSPVAKTGTHRVGARALGQMALLAFAGKPYDLKKFAGATLFAGAEFGEERVAHRVELEMVGLDEGRGLDDHLVDVADQLQALVEVLAVEAEPLP